MRVLLGRIPQARAFRRLCSRSFFFFNDTATPEIYTLSLHDALPISRRPAAPLFSAPRPGPPPGPRAAAAARPERPAIADCGALGLAPGRRLRSRVAGIFLFLPLLARLHFDDLV